MAEVIRRALDEYAGRRRRRIHHAALQFGAVPDAAALARPVATWLTSSIDADIFIDDLRGLAS